VRAEQRRMQGSKNSNLDRTTIVDAGLELAMQVDFQALNSRGGAVRVLAKQKEELKTNHEK
jgi:hypothetical protein